MLILMNLNSPREDIKEVKNKIISFNCTPHEIPGASKLAIGITGPSEFLIKEEFQLLPSVEEVIRVTKKYKLVSRQMKSEDTIIDVNGIKIGGDQLTIIAGPCSVESRDQIFEIAGRLKEMGVNFLRGGAYKPRSSPYAFQGLKEKGLEYLSDVKKEIGINIVTEVLNQSHIEAVAEVADIIQLGARNMQNYALLEEVGKTQKPILLKRGMSATIEELLLSAEYIVSQQNYNVILCERGIRTFETATRNTLDLNAVPVIKKNSHLPIFVDPSHGIGIWDKVPAMAMAAVAAGSDGLLIEVHTNPEKALSDGYQTLNLASFKALIEKLQELAPVINKKLNLGNYE
ncbi:MAG: 3-deoxy-7-phosphoheptulonate synthase [Ignavibacteriae bacterium HGW-Ignavibacteriae-3]|nr:MAG: 3-deoxy-7-phosphoheptulonate synthase [Ignavibacteriae bacterium HGW-Ignavibacteriae-3]